MEVFIKDKAEYLTWKDKDGSYNDLYIIFPTNSNPKGNLEIKSLDQHDLEVRAEERKKVVEELWKFIKEKEHFEGLKGYWGGNVLDLTLLQQKLTELKEIK